MCLSCAGYAKKTRRGQLVPLGLERSEVLAITTPTADLDGIDGSLRSRLVVLACATVPIVG
jgi:hypothetical protein